MEGLPRWLHLECLLALAPKKPQNPSQSHSTISLTAAEEIKSCNWDYIILHISVAYGVTELPFYLIGILSASHDHSNWNGVKIPSCNDHIPVNLLSWRETQCRWYQPSRSLFGLSGSHGLSHSLARCRIHVCQLRTFRKELTGLSRHSFCVNLPAGHLQRCGQHLAHIVEPVLPPLFPGAHQPQQPANCHHIIHCQWSTPSLLKVKHNWSKHIHDSWSWLRSETSFARAGFQEV